MKTIALLGSTGSIGQQALQVVAAYPDHFRLTSLAANRQVKLLAQQVRRFRPKQAVIADSTLYRELKEELAGLDVEILAGEEALAVLAREDEAGLVLNALVGFAGLKPTLAALAAGKNVALANKESLVAGGHLVMAAASRSGSLVLPVDSEHSAIFQCLQGQDRSAVKRIVLTASGGPFYRWTWDDLSLVTPEAALKHPNWKMGAKITIDSATLMNKGLEVIEAHWLFGLDYGQIDVVIHRESIVHSLVEFSDGAVLAQLGAPDMRVPIQYALTYPRRLAGEAPRVDWHTLGSLHFARPDTDTFPCLALAYCAGCTGGSMPAALNAANEEAVQLFLGRRISFTDIPRIINAVLNKHKVIQEPDLEALVEIDRLSRQQAREAAVKG